MPLLLLQNNADASARPAAVHAGTAQASARVVIHQVAHPVVTHPSHPGPVTTTTGAPEAPTVLVAVPVRRVVATTTTVAVPTTSTTTVPTPTTTRPALLAGYAVQSRGDVTYYDHPAGHCASPWLPFGTVVSITNPATNASVTCVVDDREADTARSVDLATASFAQIAPLSQGVVHADLHW